MKLKKELRSKIKSIVGNKEDTFLWLDNWHPFDALLKKNGERIICEVGLAKEAKVKEIIDHNSWNSFSTSSI